ncbi:MAG TPA: Maf family nucleotide pyrophosphatase [Denitromonas sp.]|nr:Maf family nucleotide pyrophosphatase [Denitromonas sp.]
MPLILASTSIYRRQLLERLGLPFVVARPDIDETPLDGEMPDQTAERLAIAKAKVLMERSPDALIIGSDQVARLGAQRFGKPGSVPKAVAQLQQMRGQRVVFHTAVALVNSNTGNIQVAGVPTVVHFRDLSDDEIVRYVEKEMPLDCAGSAKAEGLGISLLDALSGDDPTALIGLPLIALSRMLRAEGVVIP